MKTTTCRLAWAGDQATGHNLNLPGYGFEAVVLHPILPPSSIIRRVGEWHYLKMAPGGKSTVFRVTGLPEDQTDEQLAARLRLVIDEKLQEHERLEIVAKVAVVPSCQNGETSIALVEFAGGTPQFLSELVKNPLGDWQVEIDDTDINFDRHFFGFTQLYATEPGKAVIAE